MTISKVQIFNIALNILGVSTPLENTNGDDNKAILLNNYYNLAKEYVLKAYDWNFASCFCKLTPTKDALINNSYKYAYTYPNDCVCARDVFEKGTYVPQKFSIAMLDEENKGILTDTKEAILRYTKRIDKEVFFSCEFSMALAYYLASLTSSVITGSLQKGEGAYEKYKQILSRAKVLNAQEGSEEIYQDVSYIDSRG